MKKANHGAIRHYIEVDARLNDQFESAAVSGAEYCATSDAHSVALFYLDAATDLDEFRAALAANRKGGL